ncbi:diaminopimelate decarboxylase [Vibrio sp. SCSIO 43133]|uniref:diaminopimelate decarboxylase family protein n=1 Tax=Vibrio sp. SCSIO 43133 TaxID=2802577 RepID=UPI0020756E23|nr:diaminopimelate decarboxylase [Vibrio sp. SCSIO 43133]USE01600.1 diaminopimelate decarboxylase [Vibrio sp. SCSIO 43133]
MKNQALLEESVKQLSTILETQQQLLAEHKANQNYAERLENILTPTDELTTQGDDLLIGGCKATDLIEQYGSPLFVLSEDTLRNNLRRVKNAFGNYWPKPVNVMFAIKSNTNFAVRAICNEEGVGGDCFGPGEVEATYIAGADPKTIALNGTVKPELAIRKAIEYGYAIHLDSYEEIEIVERIAREVKPAEKVRIAVRLKVIPEDFFNDFEPDAYPFPNFIGAMKWIKFGLLKEEAKKIVNRVKEIDIFEFYGFHTHLGRFSKQPEGWDALYREYARNIIEISRECGVQPFQVDLGGGWPREREPECRSKEHMMNPNTIEDYAKVVCGGMLEEFTKEGFEVPQLWLEPGRYIAGNIGTLLTSVYVVKDDQEMDYTYTMVDASTYLATLVESQESKNPVLPANKMTQPLVERTTEIAGPICIPSIWESGARMPALQPKDVLAIMDVGHYAESQASQFNSLPRPATVLVKDGEAELIKRAETVEDVFATQILPERFVKAKAEIEKKMAKPAGKKAATKRRVARTPSYSK